MGPDNGILTYVSKTYGITEVREIDENSNRLTHKNSSYETFHGRDVFAFTGAKLASNTIAFEQVGKIRNESISFEIAEPKIITDGVQGEIVVLDGLYGNLWTNIDINTAEKLNLILGKLVLLEIYSEKTLIYSSNLKFVKTFNEVKAMEPLIYINSIGNLSIALNQGNFASKFDIKPGYKVKLKIIS